MKSQLLNIILSILYSLIVSGCFLPPLSYQTAKTLERGEMEITPFAHVSNLEAANVFGGGCFVTIGISDKFDYSYGGGFELIDSEVPVVVALGSRLRAELIDDALTLSTTCAMNANGALITLFPEIIYSYKTNNARIFTYGLGYQWQNEYEYNRNNNIGITTKFGCQFNHNLRLETGIILMDKSDVMFSLGIATPINKTW